MSSTLSEHVEFAGAAGERLAGRLDRPAGAPRAVALFAHCFTCSKESKAASVIAQTLAAAGFAVLRFDFTGLGASEGAFESTDFSSNVGDLVAAADHLRATLRAPALLVGHSLGGTAVLAAAARIPEARALVTIGSPFAAAHVLALLGADAARIEADGAAEIDIGGRPFRVRREFIADVRAHDPATSVAALGRPLLVMHSPRDAIVDIENATRLFVAAKHPKSFVSLEPADHLLTRREDGRYAAEVIAAWASRFVADERPAAPAAVSGRVVVRETGEGVFANHVVIGAHRLRADEPVAIGGLDSGPAPYDYLAAALGACTAMTIRLYANLKKLPLARVGVEVEFDRIHAADCADCETKEGKIDRLQRVITLEGDLDAAGRERLLAIANKCPVHRTLESEVRVETRLAS